MPQVCPKCLVGWQYLMIVENNKFICISCFSLSKNLINKYERKRLMLWQKKHQKELKIKNS